MNDRNFLSAIVKVLENPKEQITSENIRVTTFHAQFPQVRKNSIIFLKIWDHLENNTKKNYNVNDYLLIEGYLAIKNEKNRNFKLQITVLKIYPFFFL